MRSAKKSLVSLLSGTLITSAPERIAQKEWIGYEGSGTSAVSPERSSTQARCARPSLAPMVTTTSDSGSISTAKRLA